MSNGDYYVGHPVVAYTVPAPAPGANQAPQVNAGGEQTPVSTQTPGPTQNDSYYVGHPVSPEKTPQPAQPQPPAASPDPIPVHRKRSSFLSICFPCIRGSRVAEQ